MMPRPAHSLEPAYFDRKYAEKLDYWDFATSRYEAAKYATTVAALPRAQYQNGFEIGCSIGVLTAMLAKRCKKLLSVDVAEAALAVARQRCVSLPQVELANLRFPRQRPPESSSFDLIVVSEVGYYWAQEELSQSIQWLAAHLILGGHLVLVHYTPFVSDYPLTGDEVHEEFLTAPYWRSHTARRHPQYRLNVLERY